MILSTTFTVVLAVAALIGFLVAIWATADYLFGYDRGSATKRRPWEDEYFAGKPRFMWAGYRDGMRHVERSKPEKVNRRLAELDGDE